ncbi:MAG: hypothetical protein R6W68_13135 [Ignavibacteriaceae bacterium]
MHSIKQLNIPKLNVDPGYCGGAQARKTAALLVTFEKDFIENPGNIFILVSQAIGTRWYMV